MADDRRPRPSPAGGAPGGRGPRTPPRAVRQRVYSQNFLTDKRVIEALVDGSGVGAGDLVLDIGAGNGLITAALARRGARVVAIERDPALVRRLRARFGPGSGVTLVAGDVLTAPLPREPFAVVANIPFGITTKILRRLLGDPAALLRRADVIVQAEVARKRAAGRRPTVGPVAVGRGAVGPGAVGPGAVGPGAVGPGAAVPGAGVPGAEVRAPGAQGSRGQGTLLNASWEPWFEFGTGIRVPRSAFRPQPRVDGAVLIVRRRAQPLVDPALRQQYAEFVTAAFTRARPTVSSALTKPLPGMRAIGRSRFATLAAELGFPAAALPSQLQPEHWAGLFLAARVAQPPRRRAEHRAQRPGQGGADPVVSRE